jgi:signal transduction histidine kinase/ligand-binding sensor domain-containing protein
MSIQFLFVVLRYTTENLNLNKAIFLLLSILCIVIKKTGAQNTFSNPIIYSITEEHGLSDNHTTCILKDNQNLVWIGTSDGLNLMNGSTIKIFKHNQTDSNSICSNNINCLAQDEQSNIWVGTESGLCYYEKFTHQFVQLLIPVSPYGRSDFIKAILVTPSRQVWCATDGGLYLFQPKEKKFESFFNTAADINNKDQYCNKITCLVQDPTGVLWLSTADGLWSFNPSTQKFKKEISEKNDNHYNGLFISVFEDHLGRIWTSSWQGGLKQYDPVSGKVAVYPVAPTEESSFSQITEIQRADGSYVLWLNGKFLGFDPEKKEFFHFRKPFQYADYPDVVPYLYSSDKRIWLTTANHGFYVYNSGNQFFSHLLFTSRYTTQSVVFNKWEHLLIAGGKADHFLKAYDNRLSSINKFLIPLPDSNTETLCIDKENENSWWVGTTSGILHFYPFSGNTQWFHHKDEDSNSIPVNFITKLLLDSGKKLWVFLWRKGIWQMDTLTGHCTLLFKGFLKEGDNIKPLVVGDAVEDDQHNIWMADYDEGIILYNRKTRQFSKPFVKQLGERSSSDRIFFKNGFCYSFTTDAIIKWNTHTLQFSSFPLPEEMDKAIYDITEDMNGNWWLATKNGLIIFNEVKNSFKRFSVTDGLLYNDMNGNMFCLNDSTMVFGAQNYFTVFDPHSLLTNPANTGNILVTNITANGNEIVWDKNQTIHLRYNTNNLFFKWALPDYTSPFKNQYYCKLISIDDDWRYVGNKGEIQYVNLSPGKYSIEFKAENANGISTSSNVIIDFIIDPPFWKAGWFIALVSLLFISAFIIVIRYVAQRNLKEKLLLLEKEQAVEKERNRISRDMHDDLGSGLTKIAILSEVTKKQLNEPEKAKQQLETISESSRELVDSLQDIIWILNPKNDTLENLAAYTREYGLKFFEPFETEINFNYPEKFPDTKLSEETRRNIFLVIKESFNNISKHAWCNKISVSIAVINKEIIITIEDDGRGFDQAKVRLFGNGLVNMNSRIEHIGGVYKISSVPGKGTKTKIKIPV